MIFALIKHIKRMKKVSVSDEVMSEFASRGREVASKGLVNCSSGNISFRLNEECILISQTGCWLENMTEVNISVMNIRDGSSINQIIPSGEWKLHAGIYKQRPDVNVILHFQSPNATTLACIDKKPDYNAIIEIPLYIGNIPHVPFLMPGSIELANAVAEQCITYNVIQLSNHGQVAIGRNYKEVVERAVFFELSCSIIIKAGVNLKSIPEFDLDMLKSYRK
jgi:ribulose-5-phosphate 4-epimerase/fuculose-1-phosphate aldolase